MKLKDIKTILAICIITLLATQVSLAQGLLNPSGSLKWKSEFERYNDSSTNLNIYSDYDFNFAGPLGFRKLGSYSLNLNHRDYIKTDSVRPTVTTYNFSTNLFPESFFALNLGTGKARTKYDPNEENDTREDLIDTISKHRSLSFNTPLLFGFRFSYNLNTSHEFDEQKTQRDNERTTERIRLNKNIKFGKVMTSRFGTIYTNNTKEDLLQNSISETNSTTFFINNNLHTKPFSLTDLDSKYSENDQGDKKNIGYELRATLKPLNHLKFRTTHLRNINEEKIGADFKEMASTVTSRVNFTADPYSILRFTGGLTQKKSKDEEQDRLNSRSLSGNFGFRLSLWEQFPINFNISKGETKKFADTPANEEESRNESTSMRLSNNLNLGNFNLHSRYSRRKNKKTEVTGTEGDNETKNENLNIGLNYRRNLTRRLSFRGSTSFHSDMETFEYNPNYNLRFRYRASRNLRLNLSVNGYQQDEKKELNEDGDMITTQQEQGYRKWKGNLSYSMQRFRFKFNVNQRSDFIDDKKTTTVGIDSTYYYRAVELNLDTTWRETDTKNGRTSDELEVTSSVIRRF